MLQSVMTEPGKIEFRQIEKPAFNADEILMQTKRIGVCGSDIQSRGTKSLGLWLRWVETWRDSTWEIRSPSPLRSPAECATHVKTGCITSVRPSR
jgi:hypothetical protein